jgi:AraC-like DNA-binding protein
MHAASLNPSWSKEPTHATVQEDRSISTHQYLVEVRVYSAHALLASGAERPTLAEVAAAVGFSDQSYLTRQFKRILGTTPKKART